MMRIFKSLQSHIPTPQPFLTDDPDVLMKQYQLLIDVHKFYFGIVLKFMVFSYAVTGAIVSYYLSKPNVGAMRFALVFPIAMTGIFSWLCLLSSIHTKPMTDEVHRVVGLLGLLDYPEPRFLAFLLIGAGFLFGCTSVVLIVLSLVRHSP